ncbi:MAG: right-handed parallel beta-helix repeat-containing protein [Phycisphaeraceae bacterium]|nr:right-handed parallel beta-helix repeat-containing protein [Phycisphaeraceae bacterium]
MRSTIITRQHRGFLLICMISMVLLTVADRAAAAGLVSMSKDAARPTRITFDSASIGRFIEGKAPAVSVALDGKLPRDMYLRIELWEMRPVRPNVAFSQNITAALKSDGSYILPRAQFNKLLPGNYKLELELRQAAPPGFRTVSRIEQSFVVEPTPTVAPPAQPESQPDVPEPSSPTPKATLPKVNATSGTLDTPLQNASTKQEVWNLIPQSNTTYSNLILRGGVRAVWQSINNVTFIDCDFRDSTVMVTVQARDDGSDASSNWKFIRCTFVGATRSDWGHSHGAFLQGADKFVFTNCVFSFNGWLGEQRFNQNHNVYMLDVGEVTFSGCIFHRGAAQGLKGLGYRKLEVTGCVFSGNLIDIGSDDRSASNILIVRNCRFYNVGGQDSVGNTLGWSLALEHYNNPLNYVLIQGCKWYGPAVTFNAWAAKLAGSGVHSATISDCDLTSWQITTSTWPKIVNYIGTRLTMTNIIGFP